MEIRKRLVFLMVFLSILAFTTNGYAKSIPSTHLVTTKWVSNNLSKVIIIDTRSARSYARGHLPGAVNITWKYFTQVRNGISRYVTNPGRFQVLMRYAGVNNNSTVIFYGRTTDPKITNDPARALWTAYYYGMKNIAIMDGGITKWKDEGREITKKNTMKKQGNFKITKVRRNILATFDDILVARYTGTQIVDIRPPYYYNGVVEDFAENRFGHIPGAFDFVQGAIYRKVGNAFLYPSKKSVIKMAKKVGINLNKPIVTYCNSGHCGSAGLVIFKFITGVKNWAVYDGSMYEYSKMPVNVMPGMKRGSQSQIDSLK